MPQELPCVECVRHREPTPLPTNMTSTAILRVCSGSLAATRKGRSRACHFGTTFKSWCKIFFACGGHQMIFLSRLGPGSSPGRAESQLSQVSSGSFLIFSVLNGQRCSSCRAPQPQPQAQRHKAQAQATQRESSRCSRQAQRAPAQLCRRHGGSSRGRCRRRRAAAAVVVCAVAVGRCVVCLWCGHTR